MQRSDDHQDSTTSTEIHKPVQETGDSVLESSTTVGNFCNVNGTLLTDSVASVEIDMQSYASNVDPEKMGMDETSNSLPYVQPSQEVGYSNPCSALVTGAAAVDPEVKEVYHFLKLVFIIALIVILLNE